MACDFRKNKDQIMGEFESYYAKMPFDTGRQQKQLDEWLNEKQYTYSYEKRRLCTRQRRNYVTYMYFTAPHSFLKLNREENETQVRMDIRPDQD